MKKHVSLQLSKELHELAEEKGFILPESEMSWQKWDAFWFLKPFIKNGKTVPADLVEFSALDCQELGEVLREWVLLIKPVFVNSWEFNIKEHSFMCNCEAEIRGKLLIYLLKNNLIKN